MQMLTLSSIGEQIALQRKILGLSQAALAKQAKVGHSTLDALENGRLGELGLSKIIKLLSILGMKLNIQEASGRRPTLEELMEEDQDDQGLDRQRRGRGCSTALVIGSTFVYLANSIDKLFRKDKEISSCLEGVS
jgi:transcriptional regulator with XRE-family HTH domain